MVNAFLIAVEVLTGVLLILFILLHAGRGGGLSDMFGGGQLGGAMAGSTAVERNLDRLTVLTAVLFTFATIVLAVRVD